MGFVAKYWLKCAKIIVSIMPRAINYNEDKGFLNSIARKTFTDNKFK